jgi:hypothetical protein
MLSIGKGTESTMLKKLQRLGHDVIFFSLALHAVRPSDARLVRSDINLEDAEAILENVTQCSRSPPTAASGDRLLRRAKYVCPGYLVHAGLFPGAVSVVREGDPITQFIWKEHAGGADRSSIRVTRLMKATP